MGNCGRRAKHEADEMRICKQVERRVGQILAACESQLTKMTPPPRNSLAYLRGGWTQHSLTAVFELKNCAQMQRNLHYFERSLYGRLAPLNLCASSVPGVSAWRHTHRSECIVVTVDFDICTTAEARVVSLLHHGH